jgi:hypothetical protein
VGLTGRRERRASPGIGRGLPRALDLHVDTVVLIGLPRTTLPAIEEGFVNEVRGLLAGEATPRAMLEARHIDAVTAPSISVASADDRKLGAGIGRAAFASLSRSDPSR